MLNSGALYCENFSANFIVTEPINSVTNLSFMIAGTFLLKIYFKQEKKEFPIYWLITLLFLIGIGSSAWHLTQSKIGELLDVIPILLFMISSIVIFLNRIVKWKWYLILITVIGFFVASALAPNLFKNDPLKTSAGYLPALSALLLFTLFAFINNHKILKCFVIASVLFVLSITLRSLDFLVCTQFPVGTHFTWHILNGFVLYYITLGFIKAEKQ